MTTTRVCAFGIDRARAHLEGVDVADHIADRHADHETERVRLGHLAGGDAHRIPGRLGGAEEIAEIGRLHPAAGMLEHDVGMFLGDVEGELLVAEAGGEDQLRALLHHAFHDALGLGGLRHVLGLDQLEAGDRFLHRLEPVLHRAVVAVVVDAADIDRADNQRRLVLRRGRAGDNRASIAQHAAANIPNRAIVLSCYRAATRRRRAHSLPAIQPRQSFGPAPRARPPGGSSPKRSVPRASADTASCS